MMELRLLGTLSLVGRDGEAVPAILRQSKRLALLAYLAVESPRGFHRRDTLVALLWPERDTEHARAALSDALYNLRRHLTGGLIVSRGDEEVGLGDSGWWCDAVAVEDAVRAGRLEEAVNLYGGAFLPGFHLADAPEFDRWVEGIRTRLTNQVAGAASALADREAASGRPGTAVRWGRQAVELLPYQEEALRRLLILLDDSGSRAEAVLEYDRFARRLASDLDVEPSAETMALIQSIRERRSSGSSRNVRESPPAQVGAIEEPPVTVAPLPSLSRAEHNRQRFWLLLVSLIVVALATILLVISGIALRRRAPGLPTTVAVLPFAYQGRPEFSYLAEGMVNLLSVKLDGVTGVHPVDSRALLDFVGHTGGKADPMHAEAVARHFGAGQFVLGSITEAGGRLDVIATVYDSTRRPEHSFEARAAAESEIFDVADRLARDILPETLDKPLRLARVAAQSTASLPALKAYLEAEREIRAARLDVAEERLREAVALDSAFALAYYRLAELTYGYNEPVARQMVEHALQHIDRLGEHYRGLVLAMSDFLRGAHTAADQRYRQIASAYPDDVEAWYMLGQIIQRKGHLLGRAWADARQPYERVLALDPQNAMAVWWLAAIAAREGRRRDLDSLTTRLLRLQPELFWVVSARGQRAIVLGDTAQEAAYLAELRTRKDLWAQSSAGLVTYTTGNLSAGRRLWGLIAEPTRSPSMRLLARTVLAKLEVTAGRRRFAETELDTAKALDPGTALEYRAAFALTRFLHVPASELMALRKSLQRWNPPASGIHRVNRLYLLGLISARLGDEAAAMRDAAELDRPLPLSVSDSFAADEAIAVRSEVAWMQGRREEALADLENAGFWTNNSGLEDRGDSPFPTHLHERFARAELLYELGRREEALRWFRPLTYDFLYTAPAELRAAQIYQQKGDRESARAHYSRFVELWANSDSDLQPKVREAQEALAQLQ